MGGACLRIALVGMPGSGKTTIGTLLAQRLGCRFVDLDQYIVDRTGKGIDELFSNGEDSFRDVEQAMLAELTETDINDTGIVVSTGGGIVKRRSNIALLKQKYVVVYINRRIDDILSTLDADSRPLLKNNTSDIYRLYEERHGLYEECCSFEVDNSGRNPEKVVQETVETLEKWNGTAQC